MSLGTSMGSPILKEFPRAHPCKMPPVECEDPLAGASLSDWTDQYLESIING